MSWLISCCCLESSGWLNFLTTFIHPTNAAASFGERGGHGEGDESDSDGGGGGGFDDAPGSDSFDAGGGDFGGGDGGGDEDGGGGGVTSFVDGAPDDA